MKTFRSVLALLVVAGLALFVYDYYRRIDRQSNDEAAGIAGQTRALQVQAQELHRRLQDANEKAMALEQEAAGQQRDAEERKAAP